ncbi:tumor necrosis factor ligand superfamily member 4 isoform X10 [Pan troglodytes]|uniref:tumor necrosis factor ligand superfamily member 4 isoform X10 n=1 Tax=Pan troglodytes TaxID=9598 RepID=UPI000511F2FA|nr:tumor necrosis factor ligand superfamily member 4 isoform X4 [Pan troglodytes]
MWQDPEVWVTLCQRKWLSYCSKNSRTNVSARPCFGAVGNFSILIHLSGATSCERWMRPSSANLVSHRYPRIQSIKVQFTEYKKEKGFILTSQKEDEVMKVQNNSVIINCDGFYLISLKGYFSQEVNISLHYQKDEEPLFQLKKVRSVNSLMVASLTYKDKVYLNVTTDNTSLDDFHVNGGELILIHQNPGEFCVL